MNIINFVFKLIAVFLCICVWREGERQREEKRAQKKCANCCNLFDDCRVVVISLLFLINFHLHLEHCLELKWSTQTRSIAKTNKFSWSMQFWIIFIGFCIVLWANFFFVFIVSTYALYSVLDCYRRRPFFKHLLPNRSPFWICFFFESFLDFVLVCFRQAFNRWRVKKEQLNWNVLRSTLYLLYTNIYKFYDRSFTYDTKIISPQYKVVVVIVVVVYNKIW